MPNFISYLLANTYSGATPIVGAASASGWGLFAIMGTGLILMVIGIAGIILVIVSMWKLYVKAGQAGWKSLIPIYNLIVLLRIINKPLWWIILLFIPYVNIVFSILITHNTSKVFGKDAAFTVGLFFLPFIFYPILAFGEAVYTPPPISA